MNASDTTFYNSTAKTSTVTLMVLKTKKKDSFSMRKQWAKLCVQSGFGKFYDQRRWKLYRTLLRNGRQGEMSIQMGQGPLQRDVIAWMLFLFFFSVGTAKAPLSLIIIHQTHYEKSDWSRAFNQFTIACELDMINVISAADIVFIMSNSTSAWLPSLLECSPQKQNG